MLFQDFARKVDWARDHPGSVDKPMFLRIVSSNQKIIEGPARGAWAAKEIPLEATVELWTDRATISVSENSLILPASDVPTPYISADQGPGIPKLLEAISEILGESVYLWCVKGNDMPWRVWSGYPAATVYPNGAGQWGVGDTAYEALVDAMQRITTSLFKGLK